MRDFSNLILSTAILACFVGLVTARQLGTFSLDLNLVSCSESMFTLGKFPGVLAVGLIVGIVGAIFNRAVLISTHIQQNLPWGLANRVALAGLISGLMIVALSPLLEDGIGLKELLVDNKSTWEIAALALVSKFVMAVVAYGSGAPGGLFSPGLILGGSLGIRRQ